MEFRPLVINVKSAKDLKNVNVFTKMDVYAIVSINGDPRTAQRTPVDKNCGSKPKWNYTMKFTIDEAGLHQNQLNLVFYLKSDRVLGDRNIGAVQVPIKELFGHNNGKEESEEQVSYSVRLPNGKPKGVLDFSYKFGEKFSHHVPQSPGPVAAEAIYVNKHEETPAMAYPPPPPPPAGYYLGPSSAYPPPPHMGGYPYHHHPPPGGYLQYGYQQGPAPPAGYGYPGYNPAQGGYGYPPPANKPVKSGMGGAGLGLGLAGGLLGGMLIGDMVGDAYEAGLDYGLDYDF
ncbi:hypothetical protein PTKIN_Ptkin06aG0209700 [Pterospermum kingtungense]